VSAPRSRRYTLENVLARLGDDAVAVNVEPTMRSFVTGADDVTAQNSEAPRKQHSPLAENCHKAIVASSTTSAGMLLLSRGSAREHSALLYLSWTPRFESRPSRW
jgi:hypothetical protein